MEFKKCLRCGSFFLSSTEICPKCLPKDESEIAKINDYINENNILSCSRTNLSVNTGVSLKNINRFIDTNVIPNITL